MCRYKRDIILMCLQPDAIDCDKCDVVTVEVKPPYSTVRCWGPITHADGKVGTITHVENAL